MVPDADSADAPDSNVSYTGVAAAEARSVEASHAGFYSCRPSLRDWEQDQDSQRVIDHGHGLAID